MGTQGGNSFSGETPNGDSFKELAQLLLKDHDDHDQENGEESLKDPRRHLQVEVPSDDIDAAKNKDAANHEGGPRLPRPNDGGIEQHRHEDDIDDLRESDGWKRIYDGAVAHTQRLKYHVLQLEEITRAAIVVACPSANVEMLATSRAGFDLPYRKAHVAPAEAACFLVEAGSTWDFSIDVRTHPWMERICLHRGLDGSDSFLSWDRGGNRNHLQFRRVSQRDLKSGIAVQRPTAAQRVNALKLLSRS